jgi:hypothetical protein
MIRLSGTGKCQQHVIAKMVTNPDTDGRRCLTLDTGTSNVPSPLANSLLNMIWLFTQSSLFSAIN